jgi:hypothetical protein
MFSTPYKSACIETKAHQSAPSFRAGRLNKPSLFSFLPVTLLMPSQFATDAGEQKSQNNEKYQALQKTIFRVRLLSKTVVQTPLSNRVNGELRHARPPSIPDYAALAAADAAAAAAAAARTLFPCVSTE